MEFVDYIEEVNGVGVWHRGGGYDIEFELGSDDAAAAVAEDGVTVDSATEQRHRKWVESEGWRVAGQSAISMANESNNG